MKMAIGRRNAIYVAIAGFCLALTSAGVSADSTEVLTFENETTPCAPLPIAAPIDLPIPFRACYTEVSKVTQLMTWMSAVIRMLNTDQDFEDSNQIKLKKLNELHEFEMCTEKRIELLTEELRWVSRRLWQLSIRLDEPAEAEVQQLDKRKVDLILHLQNIRVLTGSTPTSSMLLQLFDNQLEFLEYGFNTALVMFQTERPPRRPSSSRAIRGDSEEAIVLRSILDPSKSRSELVDMSRDHPHTMTEALPQLISDWYAGNLRNVHSVLDFIKSLPKVVHQMIAFSSLYDEMKTNSDLETYELTEVVYQLKLVNASITAAADSIPRSTSVRYSQLLHDVWPIYRLVGTYGNCYYGNVKYGKGLNNVNSQPLLNPSETYTGKWTTKAVSDTPMFTGTSWYSSDSDVFSASKRNMKTGGGSGFFVKWKLVPVQGGKYFKILYAMHDEVLFADKTEMDAKNPTFRRTFLARYDYQMPHDIEPTADLWTVECI